MVYKPGACTLSIQSSGAVRAAPTSIMHGCLSHSWWKFYEVSSHRPVALLVCSGSLWDRAPANRRISTPERTLPPSGYSGVLRLTSLCLPILLPWKMIKLSFAFVHWQCLNVFVFVSVCTCINWALHHRYRTYWEKCPLRVIKNTSIHKHLSNTRVSSACLLI